MSPIECPIIIWSHSTHTHRLQGSKMFTPPSLWCQPRSFRNLLFLTNPSFLSTEIIVCQSMSMQKKKKNCRFCKTFILSIARCLATTFRQKSHCDREDKNFVDFWPFFWNICNTKKPFKILNFTKKNSFNFYEWLMWRGCDGQKMANENKNKKTKK